MPVVGVNNYMNIIEEYNKGQSINQIAKKYHISYRVVKNTIEKNNLPKRDGRKSAFALAEINDIISLYEQGNPLSFIRKKYSSSIRKIKKILKENNIQIRTQSQQGKYREYDSKVTNTLPVQEIISLYVDEQYSLLQLSRKYKCSSYCCKQILEKNNIQIRDCNCKLYTSRKYSKKIKINYSEKYKEELKNNTPKIIDLYKNHKYSMSQLSKKFKHTQTTIKQILDNNNVKIKPVSEIMTGKTIKSKIRDSLPKDKIIDHYVNKNMSLEEIAKKYNVSTGPIYGVLRAANIKIHFLDIHWFEKSKKAALKHKPYTLPSGKIIKVQGYEPQFLDYVFENNLVKEEDFDFRQIRIPYKTNDNKRHYYYPDFHIPSKNLIIEIKSTYILNKQGKDIQELKHQACINKGFNYILILDNNMNLFA
jgi:transposase